MQVGLRKGLFDEREELALLEMHVGGQHLSERTQRRKGRGCREALGHATDTQVINQDPDDDGVGRFAMAGMPGSNTSSSTRKCSFSSSSQRARNAATASVALSGRARRRCWATPRVCWWSRESGASAGWRFTSDHCRGSLLGPRSRDPGELDQAARDAGVTRLEAGELGLRRQDIE